MATVCAAANEIIDKAGEGENDVSNAGKVVLG